MKNKIITGVVIALAVVAITVVWVMYEYHNKPANPRIVSGVRQIILKYPQLKPTYDDAMSDGVLTLHEANEIIKGTNRLKQSR